MNIGETKYSKSTLGPISRATIQNISNNLSTLKRIEMIKSKNLKSLNKQKRESTHV